MREREKISFARLNVSQGGWFDNVGCVERGYAIEFPHLGIFKRRLHTAVRWCLSCRRGGPFGGGFRTGLGVSNRSRTLSKRPGRGQAKQSLSCGQPGSRLLRDDPIDKRRWVGETPCMYVKYVSTGRVCTIPSVHLTREGGQ